MTGYVWAKTLLSAYRLVPKIVRDVQEIVRIQALKSSGFFESNFSQLSTISQISKMEKLVSLKDRAIFLKDYVEEIMSQLEREQQILLSELFFKRNRITDVVQFKELSERTYYRKIKRALMDFEQKMKENSYKIADFQRDFFEDAWFIKLKELHTKQQNRQNSVSA